MISYASEIYYMIPFLKKLYLFVLKIKGYPQLSTSINM